MYPYVSVEQASLGDKGGRGVGDDLPLLARLHEAESGRVMEVFGSQPSVQVYTANYLSEGPWRLFVQQTSTVPSIIVLMHTVGKLLRSRR